MTHRRTFRLWHLLAVDYVSYRGEWLLYVSALGRGVVLRRAARAGAW